MCGRAPQSRRVLGILQPCGPGRGRGATDKAVIDPRDDGARHAIALVIGQFRTSAAMAGTRKPATPASSANVACRASTT